MLAGDTPAEKGCGECQLVVVAGDVAGESSFFMLRLLPTDSGAGGGSMGLMLAAGFFFKCDRCLSSIVIKPSFVKGFGKTSFMPSSS